MLMYFDPKLIATGTLFEIDISLTQLSSVIIIIQYQAKSAVKTIHFRSLTANFNVRKSRYKDLSHKTRMWFYLQNFTVLLVPLFHNFQEQLFYDRRVTNCPSFHYFERIQPSNKVNGVHLGCLTCYVDRRLREDSAI